MIRRHLNGLLALAVVALVCAAPRASLAGEDSDVARKAQNPLEHMISVPFENNFNFGVGTDDDMQYVLNLQPVIPFGLTRDWNLITRTIVPIIYQPLLIPGVGKTGGLGDIQASFFLSPRGSGAIIWGIGPIFSFPTATDNALGTGKLSIGPTAAALTIQGRWLVGVLFNQLFSVAGKSNRQAVSQMLIQPFINYNLDDGWYLTSSPIIIADWKAETDKWSVPVGGGMGKILWIGKAPINTSFQAFYYVAHPAIGPTWSLRLTVQFLLPE
jgi:hypothetical protein